MTPKSTHKIFVTTGSSNHTSKNRSDEGLKIIKLRLFKGDDTLRVYINA